MIVHWTPAEVVASKDVAACSDASVHENYTEVNLKSGLKSWCKAARLVQHQEQHGELSRQPANLTGAF